MANIIDYTYFINEISIPIQSRAELNAAITNSIGLYEDEILKLLLGYKLWKEMRTAFDALPTALPTKWDRFINGAEFEFELNGVMYLDKWIGLKNTSKRSFIANYVYFFHRRNNVSQNSGIGETVSTAENSRIINPMAKLHDAWNKMIDMYGEAETSGVDNTSYAHYNDKPSAYNFLLANIADYQDWRFTKLDKKLSPLRMLM